jgi:hypothetical protein
VDTPLSSRRWWIFAAAVVRGVLTATVLVALYYLLPLDSGNSGTSAFVKLAIALVVFAGVMTWQIRSITKSGNPALRAFEGLFLAVPLFLLIFASAYYVMGQADAASFTADISRTDALYFTVTIFSTVGFVDISAKTETARLVVTAQMFLDLVVLGFGLKIILNAVERGRQRLTNESSAEVTPE